MEGRGPDLIISGFRLPVVKRQMFPKVADAENRTHFSLLDETQNRQVISTFLLI